MNHIQLKIKTFAIGNYIQIMKYFIHEETVFVAIQDLTCCCRYGSIHADAWIKAKGLCHHIKKLVIEYERLQKG